jgi:hypothetical protein
MAIVTVIRFASARVLRVKDNFEQNIEARIAAPYVLSVFMMSV